MWKKCGAARQARDDSKIRRMRFACWITKTTNKCLVYIILTFFSRQQRLFEGALLLRV
jgi:hypothetical protein